MSDRLPAVLEEIGRVRVELGSPIMVTPYPAIVSAQAVMNVLNGERYKVVPDEVKKYVCGYFGALPLPVDGNVKDRIITNGSKDVALTPPVIEPVLPKPAPALQEHRRRRAAAALHVRRREDRRLWGRRASGDTYSVHHPVVDLVAGLATRPRKSQVQVSGAGFSLSAN